MTLGITPFGRFLRRWSLDELPQFWNVFKGDMSLIGPRPEEARIVALYNDWHRRRLAVKPGITGPMQINGRGDLPLDKRVQPRVGLYRKLFPVAGCGDIVEDDSGRFQRQRSAIIVIAITGTRKGMLITSIQK